MIINGTRSIHHFEHAVLSGQVFPDVRHGTPTVPGSIDPASYALMPPGARRHQLKHLVIENATLVMADGSHGAILDQEGFLLDEASCFSELNRRWQDDHATTIPDPQETLDDIAIGFDAAWRNYYHWMIFGVARSIVLDRLMDTATKLAFPVAAPISAVQSAGRAYKAFVDIFLPPERVAAIPDGVYRVKRLHYAWSTGAAPTTVVDTQAFADAMEEARARATRASADFPGSSDRIFVSRQLTPAPRITPEEQARLAPILERHGFRTLFLETMPFGAQVQAFANARVIVSPHGAGLTNLMFAHPECRVLELNRRLEGDDGPRPWFYQLATRRGLDYAGFDLDEGVGVLGDLDATL